MLGISGAVSGTIAIASAVGPIVLGARGAMGFKDSMTIGCIWQEFGWTDSEIGILPPTSPGRAAIGSLLQTSLLLIIIFIDQSRRQSSAEYIHSRPEARS